MARGYALTRPSLREALRLSEALAGFVEHVFGLAERKADEVLPELLAGEERRARDSRDADLRHEPAREESVVLETERTDVAENVVRAIRRVRSEAGRGKRAHEDIAAGAGIEREALGIRTAERGGRGRPLPERRRRADGHEGAQLANARGELGRGGDPADPAPPPREGPAPTPGPHR